MNPQNTQIALYIASVLGAISLLLMLPKQRLNLRLVGSLLGAATLGGLWVYIAPDVLGGMGWDAFAYYYIFSAIAIIAAVRVITNTRPVYSALWFVMVILASAGLFVLLSAEFMAFAMVIIYGGAILVTYMFVIMLATQSQSTDQPDVSPAYDRVAREPLAAVVAGFVLLAVLLSVAYRTETMQRFDIAEGQSDQSIIDNVLANRSSNIVDEQVKQRLAEAGHALPETALTNTERVGVDLFRSHPLGLELAGVILLMSLIGAVVIARTHVEEENHSGEATPDATGATARPRYEPGPDDAQSIGQSGGRMGP